jgi:hypothetical protein
VSPADVKTLACHFRALAHLAKKKRLSAMCYPGISSGG